ncbi:NADH-quinone oxidoreductase subunit A [Candidatus Providencia siddallii]|uniref:NADH-quinone oxidoreductase subunit A n=1 Tax=Candidatus Providencia siddallii TaxID=1715285 RepID=A0ABM9NNM9_9GAMM
MILLNKNYELHYILSLSVFFIGIISFCVFLLIIGYLFGGRSKMITKHIPYESGIDSVGSARLRMSVKFYLISMFFVIFDVESMFLFLWSVNILELGWIGFIESSVFILILLLGLFYLIRIGALNWTPINSQRKVKYSSNILKISNRCFK